MADTMNNTRFLNGTIEANNTTKNSEESVESLEFKYTKVGFYFLILFCSTFGNLLVVYVICTSRRMRSASHLLILNLAICDFFTPLISIPFDFAVEENSYIWFYGELMCKILGPAATFSTTASSLTLAAISLDRYRLLMHPFKKKLSSGQIKIIIVVIYVFCGIVVSPYTYVLKVQDSSCGEHWSRYLYRQLYTMCLFLFQYAIPLLFMIIMYSLALKSLYSTSGKVRNCSIQGPAGDRDLYVNGSPPRGKKGISKVNLKSVFRKKTFKLVKESSNVKATKMFMAVVVVFAIFMFPNQVFWMWMDYGNGTYHAQTAIICWLFTYTNSVVNPIIFAIFSKEFRVGFKGVFRLLFCCNRDALPERCTARTCNFAKNDFGDSSTNEILAKESAEKKQLIYEVHACHSNGQQSDVATVTSKSSQPRYVSFSREADGFNRERGLAVVVESSDYEPRADLSQGSETHSGQHDPVSCTPQQTQTSEQCPKGHTSSPEKKREIQKRLDYDSDGADTAEKEEIPNLPLNTSDILDKLLETNC